jgi:hypothetical protein
MAQDAHAIGTRDVRSQIERTRVELGRTIDEIQDRLSPRRIIHDAKDTLSDATIGRAKRLAHRVTEAANANGSPQVQAVLDKARRNPTLMAILGIAVGALILATMTRSRRPGLAKSR